MIDEISNGELAWLGASFCVRTPLSKPLENSPLRLKDSAYWSRQLGRQEARLIGGDYQEQD
jgi:hypothetical protein